MCASVSLEVKIWLDEYNIGILELECKMKILQGDGNVTVVRPELYRDFKSLLDRLTRGLIRTAGENS